MFQLKALQKRVQKDGNIFFVAHAVPEIYRKNERLKTGGMRFFVIDCIIIILLVLSGLDENRAVDDLYAASWICSETALLHWKKI